MRPPTNGNETVVNGDRHLYRWQPRGHEVVGKPIKTGTDTMLDNSFKGT